MILAFLSWIHPTVIPAYSDLVMWKLPNRLYPSVLKHVHVTKKGEPRTNVRRLKWTLNANFMTQWSCKKDFIQLTFESSLLIFFVKHRLFSLY